ncbi:CHAT domain-containing protein [Suillus subalutaceus]|uniref:CHAT domain-containing protein n=1 Tax=Suillus subalutaceus TaxID=48586 RepID=UPI001B86198F|nr:CHAT domain-containing protein [Suillus subalutaceus]KAG1834333.1 CHAT domain-containing protein [Suillus subalutaceus]
MDHPYRPAALLNLATAKFVSCQADGRHLNLDIPINLFQDALDLHPTDHPDQTITQHLAIALELLSKILDVCHANSHIHRAALIAIETSTLYSAESIDANDLGQERPAAPMLPLSLNQLAHRAKWCLQKDDPRWSNGEDLDQAIALQREALALRPVGHTDRSRSLNNLAGQLSSRFEHRGNVEDLDQGIALQREAPALRPVGHTGWFNSLNNLAGQLSSRFEHRGNDEDLDQAIGLQREALALCPVGHTDQSLSLNNLAHQLSSRFKHRGNEEDLDQAIALQREAVALYPVGHSDWSRSLYNLAAQLSSRFEHRGNGEDLNQAIALQWEALALRPISHTDRSRSLNSLANGLSSRFSHRGNDEDLDQAIALHREALALCLVGHTDRSMSLNNLAGQLSSSFSHRGNDEDLDQGIALHREALALCPHRGNEEDLDQAIALQREALALCSFGHSDRSRSLHSLANGLYYRFSHRGNDEDLDQAIALHREALALRPVGHTDRTWSLNSLAIQLSSHFEHQRNREDLDESRDNLGRALTLLTQHDPHQLHVHNSLTNVYLLFHGLNGTSTGEVTDSLNAAMHNLKAAANVVSAGLLPRLRASLSWVRHALQHSHGTELEAHVTSMQLLDAYMSTTASVSSCHNIMKDFLSTLAVDAASCALRSGEVCRAVELLEQGRTIIWTQMTRLRTPLDSLQTCDDHAAALIKKFRDLSSLLDKPPANDREATSRVNVEAQEARYRHLVKDWNRAVEEIWKIEGFSCFLLPPLFSDLQDAARDGPIIVLIVSKSSCDAIIILHKQPPTKIPLPTNIEKLQILATRLQCRSTPALTTALAELSRIWWCPTSVFNFLPLHAAGQYWRDGQFLSQFYVSSYTPSLTALIKARRHDRSLSVSFAAIGQDHPAGASHTLECVEPELELVQSLLPPPPTVSFTKITSVDAMQSRALCALRENTWLHFSCHGTQKYEDPFNLAFLMRDQPLSLLDIAQTDLSRHEFTFLSAYDTAVGDQDTPDEVIHLAAGLQFAGVKSVVGTLWKVNDSTVQRLVEAFYKNLCGDGKMNSKQAA